MGLIKKAVMALQVVMLCADTNAAEKDEGIILGCAMSVLPSCVWIAGEKGSFEAEGIHVTIREFGSGRTALNAMFSGQDLDMVTVAQTPVVLSSFKRRDFVILASMVYSRSSLKVLARKDRGITEPSDWIGKTVGTPLGSTGHYFLGLFLICSDMDFARVTLVEGEATALPGLLARGRVENRSMPNYFGVIDMTPLKTIAFDAVTIIR